MNTEWQHEQARCLFRTLQLVPADGKDVVKSVTHTLESAGFDIAGLTVSVGPLYGLRADIVHKGIEDPDVVRASYYPLELITRLLLRHRGGITSEWPADVSANDWPEPFRTTIAELRSRPPRTFWEKA